MVGDNVSFFDGHHAPGSNVLCSRACVLLLESHSLDAVIWSSGIGSGPFTNGISKGHVGASKNQWNYIHVCTSFFLALRRIGQLMTKSCV